MVPCVDEQVGGDHHDDGARRATEQHERVGEGPAGRHLAALAEAHPEARLRLAQDEQRREETEGEPVDLGLTRHEVDPEQQAEQRRAQHRDEADECGDHAQAVAFVGHLVL